MYLQMKPEEKARQDIDRLLEAAGWNVQDYKKLLKREEDFVKTKVQKSWIMPAGIEDP